MDLIYEIFLGVVLAYGGILGFEVINYTYHNVIYDEPELYDSLVIAYLPLLVFAFLTGWFQEDINEENKR